MIAHREGTTTSGRSAEVIVYHSLYVPLSSWCMLWLWVCGVVRLHVRVGWVGARGLGFRPATARAAS